MTTNFAALTAALIAFGTGAFASPACDAINAIGRVNVSPVVGGTITLGPFMGFDEGIHEQPADGDTIQIARVGDVSVEISYQSAATDTNRIVPPRRFSSHVIGAPGSPEATPMTIVIRTLATSVAAPEVAVGCTGSPNPGRNPVAGPGPAPAPAPAPANQAVIEEVQVETAESLGRFGTAPADLPSLMITPAPGSAPIDPNRQGFDRFVDRMDRRYGDKARAAVNAVIEDAADQTVNPAAEQAIRDQWAELVQAFERDIDRIRFAEQRRRDEDDWLDLKQETRAQIRAAYEENGRQGIIDLAGSIGPLELIALVQYVTDQGDISGNDLRNAEDRIARRIDPDTYDRVQDGRRRVVAANDNDGPQSIFFDDVTSDALYNRGRLAGRMAEILNPGTGPGSELGPEDRLRIAEALIEGLDNPGVDAGLALEFDRARAEAESGDYDAAARSLSNALRGAGATRGDQARGRFYDGRDFSPPAAPGEFAEDGFFDEGETIMFSHVTSKTATFSIDSSMIQRAVRIHTLRFSEAAAAAHTPRDHHFWAKGRVTLHDGTSQGVDGMSYELQGGAVFKLSPDWEVGGFVTFFNSDLKTNTGGTDFDTDAITYGLYANHRLRQNLFLGLSAALENGDTRKTAGAVTAKYGYDKHAIAASLTGVIPREDWTLLPSGSISWSRRDTAAHTDSAARFFAKRSTETVDVSAALSASHSQDYTGRRYARITSQYRVAAHYYDRSLPVGSSDPVAGLEMGANWTFGFGNGSAILLGTAIGGIGQDTQTYSASGAINIPF